MIQGLARAVLKIEWKAPEPAKADLPARHTPDVEAELAKIRAMMAAPSPQA